MNTNKYSFIKITKRKVSEKLQPSVKVGEIYKVEGSDKTKSGAKVVIISIKGKPTRCNSERFSWEPMSEREVADKVKKVMRDEADFFTEQRKNEIAKELGDVLWYVAIMAKDLGYTLEDVAAMNIEKLQSRKERGVLGGSGDNM